MTLFDILHREKDVKHNTTKRIFITVPFNYYSEEGLYENIDVQAFEWEYKSTILIHYDRIIQEIIDLEYDENDEGGEEYFPDPEYIEHLITIIEREFTERLQDGSDLMKTVQRKWWSLFLLSLEGGEQIKDYEHFNPDLAFPVYFAEKQKPKTITFQFPVSNTD